MYLGESYDTRSPGWKPAIGFKRSSKNNNNPNKEQQQQNTTSVDTKASRNQLSPQGHPQVASGVEYQSISTDYAPAI